MELAFDRHGRGPALLLLHPLGASRRVWLPLVDFLAERRELIVPDLPGFGDSPPLEVAGGPTPARLAEAVLDFFESLELPGGVHVAGNSLGGWVALELAAIGAARSVTAIAPAGLWPQPLGPKRSLARGVARAVLPFAPALLRSPRARRAALSGTMVHGERVTASAATELIRAYATAPGFNAVNAAMRARRFTSLERIRVPVTLIWPEHDRLVRPPAHIPAGVRSLALPDAGHLPMWDAPQRLAALLLEASRT